MALADIRQLCLAHGTRAADGTVTVAWTARESLANAWAMLAEAGLNIVAFVPNSLALPTQDPQHAKPLGLPATPRWLAPLPGWSLAHVALRPASARGRWRKAIFLSVPAADVWLIGFNWYVAQF